MASENSALWMRRFSKLIPFGLLLALAAVIAPAIQQSREASRRTISRNTLKQFALGLQSYHEVFATFPPGGIFDPAGKAYHSWMTPLEPYVAQSAWYNFVDVNVPWDDPQNVGVFLNGGFVGSMMQNPSVPQRMSPDGFHLAHYAANQSLMHRNSRVRMSDLTTGTSSTLLLGDAAGQFVPSGYPFNWRDVALGLHSDSSGFGSPTRNITMVAMADASVRVLDNSIDSPSLLRMAGPKDLQPSADRTDKPTQPYRLNVPGFWKFGQCLRGHKSLTTIRTSPDGTLVQIQFGHFDQGDSERNGWVPTLHHTADSALVEAVEIKGRLDADELKPLLAFPKLKRLDLRNAHLEGNPDAILNAASSHLLVER